MNPANSITIISSPYHFGAEDEAVGGGPRALLKAGLSTALRDLGVTVHEVEIPGVEEFEGEVGKNFELLRRASKIVTSVLQQGSLPIMLAGNCTSTVGVSAGISASGILNTDDLGCIWFDAHDDINTPDVLVSGYLDSMAISVLAGQCWKTMVQTIPGFKSFNTSNLVQVGMRDVTDLERDRVNEAGFKVIWGQESQKVDFASELRHILTSRNFGPAMVHLDLDCLDISVGPVNKWPSAGGLSEDDLVHCLEMIPEKCHPVSLTIAGFDPSVDPHCRIPPVAIRGIVSFIQGLVAGGHLIPSSSKQ